MKYRIFYILYWLLSHYIPQLILATLIVFTCLTSCRTTRHHFTDATQMVTHDTIHVTHDRITDISTNTHLHYEQTILDLQTRIDSATGTPRRDTTRITHTILQRADTVILHHHDTITALQYHTDSTAIVRTDTSVTNTCPPLWSDLITKLLILAVVWTIILLIHRFNK